MPVFREIQNTAVQPGLVSTARFIRIRFTEKPAETIDTMVLQRREFLPRTHRRNNTVVCKRQVYFQIWNNRRCSGWKSDWFDRRLSGKNSLGRFYVGSRFSSGNYFSWGYLSSNIEFGTFLRSAQAGQGVFRAGANYFTNLIEIGQWKFRQFVKPQVIIGIQRTSYDSLTINNEYGLRGFNSPILSGTSRLLFTAQTQSYAPWDFIGFNFAPI